MVMFYPNDRLAVFIDGANLYSSSRQLPYEIDYKKIREYFAEKSKLMRIFYYTAVLDQEEYMPIRPLLDWLAYNGYTVVTKPAKQHSDGHGGLRTKGNMDIEIAVDAMEHAPHIDHMVLFSGDGDFRRLIESLQRQGTRVTVISTLADGNRKVADELRRQADQFMDLEDLGGKFRKAKVAAV
jgi:uncharacterized LabA/DUF88 family protein